MRFFNFLRLTRLSRLQLLDIALVMALIPHLFTLRAPMIIYMFLALIFIIKKKHSKLIMISFTLLGLLSIGLSFFAEYNFSNFSRLLVFIAFLISLLTFATVLQRLTQTINFYLLITPALLMVLSFFFFNSIGMLFYSLFTLFIFTFLILYEKLQGSFRNALRFNTLLYLFSLPIVVLLFLTFPRISYKNARFGFTQETQKRTGHDGTMSLDSSALLVPSPRVVMEVSFEKEIPENLYFRGSVLYIDNGVSWIYSKENQISSSQATNLRNTINYKVKLYPHQKQWLYMLDIPTLRPDKSFIDNDFITSSYNNIDDIIEYEARSSLEYSLITKDKKGFDKALKVDIHRDSRTYKKLIEDINIEADDETKARQLINFFSSQRLSYSLKPKKIDLEHPVDSFLFDSKIGYCVHFASSFATAARMIGLPSRIVTGYKADKTNSINNYLLVKEADAHAWVEIYIKDRGWVRFEPTSTAFQVLSPDNTDLSNSYTRESLNLSFSQKIFKQANIYYLYSRYVINRWVLQYNRLEQVALLKELLSDAMFLLKFISAMIAFIFFSISLFIILQKKKCGDALQCEMQKLLRILSKDGFKRKQGESMFDFLQRVTENGGKYIYLNEINELYNQQRYANRDNLAQLRDKILQFKKSV